MSLSEQLQQRVTEMMGSVKEMIAASKLLRARVESNDEVMKNVERRLTQFQERLDEMDRRLVVLENEQYKSTIP